MRIMFGVWTVTTGWLMISSRFFLKRSGGTYCAWTGFLLASFAPNQITLPDISYACHNILDREDADIPGSGQQPAVDVLVVIYCVPPVKRGRCYNH